MSFYKKSGVERGPFRRRDRRHGRGTGVGERTATREESDERRERADDLGDDTTKNQMHGHWLFSIRIIGFPGRRSSESPRPSRYSSLLSLLPPFSVFLAASLLRSLLRSIRLSPSPTAPPCTAAAAVSSVEPPSPPPSPPSPFSGEWAPARRAEKTSKKKSNFVAMVTGVR